MTDPPNTARCASSRHCALDFELFTLASPAFRRLQQERSLELILRDREILEREVDLAQQKGAGSCLGERWGGAR